MAHASFQKPIEDIVECSICMETLKNTRVLPCIHTFCLRCIKKHGKGKKTGDTAQCPYCRKEFLVPIGGLDKLPKNTFIEKLLEVQCTLTTEWSNSSTICTFPRHEQKSKTKSLAIWYCVECKRQMCGGCRSVHLRAGVMSLHHVLPVQKESPCEEHPYKQLDRFCKTCKTPVCGECCASNHRGHDWSTLVNYVGTQQVEMEKLRLNHVKPDRQPNITQQVEMEKLRLNNIKLDRQPKRQEMELLLPSDVFNIAVRSPPLIALHEEANVSIFKSLGLFHEVQNEFSKIAAEMDRLEHSRPKFRMITVEDDRHKSLLVEKKNKASRLTVEDERFKSQMCEGQNKVYTLAIVVLLLLAFCWQSRAWMNEERARWSAEKYNYTLSEEILKRQIQKLSVQLDKERTSYLSEKRKYAVSEDKLQRQVNDLIGQRC